MSPEYPSPIHPQPIQRSGGKSRWGRLYGSSFGLVISQTASAAEGVVLVVTPDTPSATRLEDELRFYNRGQDEIPVLGFPDWETLPYDTFSPYQDIISERLATLYQLPGLKRGILILPIATLMHRIAPRDYIEGSSLMLDVGDTLELESMRRRLESNGYRCVSQVIEHGEFAVRGSLLDLYPMGSRTPFRIELFDDEVESIRTFDPDSQRTEEKVEQIRLLPAREFPLHDEAIKRFREAYRSRFEGDPQKSIVYRDVSNGLAPPGVEYYLPLFFAQTATLLDYLPENTRLFTLDGVDEGAEQFYRECQERFEVARYHTEHPPLPPTRLFLTVPDLFSRLKALPRTELQHFALHDTAHGVNYATEQPPPLTLDARASEPSATLRRFVGEFDGRILFAAESPGRRETLLQTLKGCDIHPSEVESWQAFLHSETRHGIVVAPLEHGLLLRDPPIAVVAETQLYGERVMQRRRRRKGRKGDPEAVVRNLAELQPGAAVVHEDHGVGRYLGLQKLTVGDSEAEFLTLEYAGGDKLYVPVASLHLISRYSGASSEHIPLHKLGSGQWEKAKRKAGEKIRDVAAELLEIYAKREARQGHRYPIDEAQYAAFSAAFPFEETPDQQDAIDAVLADMRAEQPMDRLICGDVGFGKTEVAMRAAFVAVMGGRQVAVLVPTTLLAEQHTQNLRDRFADWPVRIESLSRFRSSKEQQQVLRGLEEGSVDIVIGTHKLLQEGIRYKRLGMVIIDEEHRFGVRQKERFKALRAEVDVLTLTATPIPRTLNMAMGGIRELSIIASPPARRLAVKTFVHEWNPELIKEACLREVRRGGQVYFLHNEVDTIEKISRDLEELLPEASIGVAHGQMPERELERVMSDFYHQRFNLLVCTTIIETGIDIPSANTIIINRADRLGLAQLYQLRGRVGRSHHRAYAYLLVPSKRSMTKDAGKRLEAIESIEELGTGFTLATHDLEIRGAGELLGEEQSGQMHEIGFSLYTELLERAVKSLREGQEPELEKPLLHGTEVDLGVPALIPDDYLPDVHSRLQLYKRIANAASVEQLEELQVEMIDRFGLLPEPVKNLFTLTGLKLRATPYGITKIELGAPGGRINFNKEPDIDPMHLIRLLQQRPQDFRLDGQERLKVLKRLPTLEARLAIVEELLATSQNG
ncbi:MAG: transcription-repair coupling factor [Gammaproteobacteria bacterium]|nr:transcription-repair coupling factor [Gammaproteobacteria bacterium]MCW8973657.1 transcription-repair coupling factor [Gammaproteobacteria bacterium]MCW8991685.1 transcription-repair coupling factor [Gammaproteobacteria bacterium]